MKRLAQNITSLTQATEPRERHFAARWIKDRPSLTEEAIVALIHALSDHGSWCEDWVDWCGTIVGNEHHVVSDAAAAALIAHASEALPRLLHHSQRGNTDALTRLPQVTQASSPDTLIALGDAMLRALEHEVDRAPSSAWKPKAQAALA